MESEMQKNEIQIFSSLEKKRRVYKFTYKQTKMHIFKKYLMGE